MGRSQSAFKKRKFKGNRHITVVDSGNRTRPQPNSSEATSHENVTPKTTPPSSSRKKFGLKSENSFCSDFEGCSKNVVISLEILSSIFKNFACIDCGGSVTLQDDEDGRNGLANRLLISCLDCKKKMYFYTSEKCTEPNDGVFEINVRLFYGLRSIGRGLDSGKVLCALMNLPPPSTARGKYTDLLYKSIQCVAEASMVAATKEAVEEKEDEPDEPRTDITIAFDGSWQKRGFKSKNGFATVTSLDTGKVVDVEVLSKHCDGCLKVSKDNNKKVSHEKSCVKNYEGPSGGMESVAAVRMFSRSEEKRGVRYKNFLGDGDSKAFTSVKEVNPYNGLEIKKLECVGHVKKRMGTRLRKLKSKLSGTRLRDGKFIGGAGRLTDDKIDMLQEYYGNAIRNNKDSLEGMRRAIWATYCHCSSTQESPQHLLCPDPPNTWCKYKIAEHEGTLDTYIHKGSLPLAVMEAIKPIYKDLVNPSLLRKCLHGKTQNVNESFNNVVWTRIPKGTFVGKKTLEIGVFDSVLTFNDGNVGRLRTLQHLGVQDLGRHTIETLRKLDQERLRKADKAAEDMSKEARIKKRRQLLRTEEANNDYYSPGGF